jgi:hypothetical protein
MPSESRPTHAFAPTTTSSHKTSSHHITSIVTAKQSSKNPQNFKLVFFRDGSNKRYVSSRPISLICLEGEKKEGERERLIRDPGRWLLLHRYDFETSSGKITNEIVSIIKDLYVLPSTVPLRISPFEGLLIGLHDGGDALRLLQDATVRSRAGRDGEPSRPDHVAQEGSTTSPRSLGWCSVVVDGWAGEGVSTI